MLSPGLTGDDRKGCLILMFFAVWRLYVLLTQLDVIRPCSAQLVLAFHQDDDDTIDRPTVLYVPCYSKHCQFRAVPYLVYTTAGRQPVAMKGSQYLLARQRDHVGRKGAQLRWYMAFRVAHQSLSPSFCVPSSARLAAFRCSALFLSKLPCCWCTFP